MQYIDIHENQIYIGSPSGSEASISSALLSMRRQ